MTAIERRLVQKATLDGRAIEGYGILTARIAHGYDLETAEATLEMPVLPGTEGTTVNDLLKKPVTLSIGMQTADGKFNNHESSEPPLRFSGYLVSVQRTLWPQGVQLICRGRLILACLTEATILDEDADPWIDLCNDGDGASDEDQVRAVLAQSGLVEGRDGVHLEIAGTGKLLGTVAATEFVWRDGESGKAYINRLEQICKGFRTFDDIGSTIRRLAIKAQPTESAYAQFTEGVDIFSASYTDDILGVKNRIRVTGFEDVHLTVAQASDYTFGDTNTLTISNPMIEKELEADPGDGISCEEVGRWQLGEYNRRLQKLSYVTPRDDILRPGCTINLYSPRLGLHKRFWLQHVELTTSADGEFAQVLTCIGGVGQDGDIELPAQDPLADFTLTTQEVERVIVDGAAASLYVVHCQQACSPLSAPLTGFAWSASAGANPASGAGESFVVSFGDITGATITLTCTDANGHTGSLTKPLPPASAGAYQVRRLYLAGTSCIEALEGDFWASLSKSQATAVANGPAWRAGADVEYSLDALATAPGESSPFGAVAVASLFVDVALAPATLLVGSADGRLALSTDGGDAWTINNGPPGDVNPVVRCWINAAVAGEWWALTASGLYRGAANGAAWTRMLAAAPGETFQDVAFGMTRTLVAMQGGRLLVDAAGVAQTGLSGVSSVLALAADPWSDRFYAYDAAGNTYVHAAGGDTALAAASALPAGLTPQLRGLASDPDFKGLLYIAGGAGGVWKTLDAFGSPGGYAQIRVAAVDGSPAGAVYTQVGAGLLAVPLAGPLRRVLIAGHVESGGNVYGTRFFWTENIWDPSPVWQENSDGLPTEGVENYAGRIALDPSDNDRAFLLVNGELYVNDAWQTGGTWTLLLDKTTMAGLIGNQYCGIGDFGISIGALGTLCAIVWGFPVPGQDIYLFKSVDGGANWSAVHVDTAGFSVEPKFIEIGQHDPDVIVMGWWDTVQHLHIDSSVDGGATWTTWNTTTRGCVVIPYVDNELDQKVYFTCGTGYNYVSLDGGLTWTQHPELYGDDDFVMQADSALAMMDRLGNYSDDGGATAWHTVTNSITGSSRLSISCPRADRRYIGDGNSVYTSVDKDTWVDRLGSGLPASYQVRALTVDPRS